MRVLVDVSGLCYRSAHTLDLTDADGVKTNVVYGVLLALERIVQTTDATELVICWDRGYAARSEIFPAYKEDRNTSKNRDPEFSADMRRQQDVLREVLKTLPVIQASEMGCEADDVIGLISKFTWLEKVGIVTSDKDLFQLSTDVHAILDHKGRERELDLTPKQWLAYQVLVGGHDNVPGVEGIGDKTARKLIAEHGSLKKIMAAGKAGEVKLGRMTYKQAAPIVRRNSKLMKLCELITPEQKARVINAYSKARTQTYTNENAFVVHLQRLGFSSVLARLSAFLLPFRKLEKIKSPEFQPAPVSFTRRMRRVVNGVVAKPVRRMRRLSSGDEIVSRGDLNALTVTRLAALSKLNTLNSAEGWSWLKKQATADLSRLKRLIGQFAVNATHNPWPSERAWLNALHIEFTTQKPDWMG